MKPRNRRLKLAALGTIVISTAGVCGVLFPKERDFLAQLAFAVAGLLTAVAGSMAVDDVSSAKVDVAAIVAAAPTTGGRQDAVPSAAPPTDADNTPMPA